ncbi:hypothetical protein ABRQ00_11270 [Pectobacterium aroidearum]|uniref:hypothetical protein n=1 Tax=Pectobacterium aroidearum TaxID=1201031 RepID=UPI002FC749A0
MSNKPISEVIEEAKLSATVLEFISQFEASEIESDDVDLRFEIDGVDTGCDVSITDQCGKAAGNITRLIDHIAALEQQLAAERARSKWSTGEPPDFGWYYVRYEQEIQGKSTGKFYFSRAQYLQYDPCAPSDRRIKAWIPEYARSMNGIKVTHWISLPDFIDDRIPVEGE